MNKHLRAAAEAYANLSAFQSDCYHYLNDGFDTTIQARLSDAYSAKLAAKAIRGRYIYKTVCTALAECQYPINEATGYAWNDSERAAFAGIPKQTWSDNKLSDYVDFILIDIGATSDAVRAEIELQLAGS